MTISLIVAMDRNGGIGNSKTNDMPWGRSLSEDLKFFREQTNGQVVVYGKKTFESMNSRPLPYRTNIILTHHHFLVASHPPTYGFTLTSFNEVLNYYENHLHPDRKLFVCGGTSIYEQFVPYADEIIVTHIDGEFEGDIAFPVSGEQLMQYYNSHLIQEVPVSEANPYHLTMKKYWTK